MLLVHNLVDYFKCKKTFLFSKKHLFSNAQMLGNARINAQAENPLGSGSQK